MSEYTLRPCQKIERESVYGIINDATETYRVIIPADRWQEPYIPREELWCEITEGCFLGMRKGLCASVGDGIQDVQNATLMRHACVHTVRRNQGIGGILLDMLREKTIRSVLIGT
jgi:hypothetical protein